MIIKRKAKKTLQMSYTKKSYFTGATATRKSHPRFSSFPTELIQAARWGHFYSIAQQLLMKKLEAKSNQLKKCFELLNILK